MSVKRGNYGGNRGKKLSDRGREREKREEGERGEGGHVNIGQ